MIVSLRGQGLDQLSKFQYDSQLFITYMDYIGKSKKGYFWTRLPVWKRPEMRKGNTSSVAQKRTWLWLSIRSEPGRFGRFKSKTERRSAHPDRCSVERCDGWRLVVLGQPRQGWKRGPPLIGAALRLGQERHDQNCCSAKHLQSTDALVALKIPFVVATGYNRNQLHTSWPQRRSFRNR